MIFDNQKGKTYNKDVMGSDDSLDAFMQGYIGFYESWDLWSRNFNRMVTSSWLGLGADSCGCGGSRERGRRCSIGSK